MTTTFEIGKTYKTAADVRSYMLRTACTVVARTINSIAIVEEYEDDMNPVVIPVQRVIDQYGNRFEIAKYLGENLFSYSA